MDMKLVPSVSRSSGLEHGGDVLKGAKMQEDYRNFIEEKLRRYWSQYPPATHLMTKTVDVQRSAQSNLQILFRKLREGLMASQRVDQFTLEVYETSLHLSILFRTPAQTTSIIAQLLPQGHTGGGIYHELGASHAAQPSPEFSSEAVAEMSLGGSKSRALKSLPEQIYCPQQVGRGEPPHSSSQRNVHFTPGSCPSPGPQIHLSKHGTKWATNITTVLMSLLHTLLHFYPSQAAYQLQLKSHPDFQPGKGDKEADSPHQWLRSLSTALVSRNYARCERLTRSTEVEAVHRSLGRSGSHPLKAHHTEVWRFAFKCLVEDLRIKVVRDTAWAVLATAYRELDITESGVWLSRCLMIDTDMGRDGVHNPASAVTTVEEWLRERGEMEVKRKEGVAGRWILCKRGCVP